MSHGNPITGLRFNTGSYSYPRFSLPQNRRSVSLSRHFRQWMPMTMPAPHASVSSTAWLVSDQGQGQGRLPSVERSQTRSYVPLYLSKMYLWWVDRILCTKTSDKSTVLREKCSVHKKLGERNMVSIGRYLLTTVLYLKHKFVCYWLINWLIELINNKQTCVWNIL